MLPGELGERAAPEDNVFFCRKADKSRKAVNEVKKEQDMFM